MFVADHHLNLDDRIYTHYVEMDNNVRVCVCGKHGQITKF